MGYSLSINELVEKLFSSGKNLSLLNNLSASLIFQQPLLDCSKAKREFKWINSEFITALKKLIFGQRTNMDNLNLKEIIEQL